MPRLSAIVEDRAEIDVPIGGVVLHVTYRPSAMTEIVQDEIIRGEWSWPLSELLLGWDLTDDQDEPYGTDEETLRSLGAQCVVPVLRAIGEDFAPKLRSGATSDAGSPSPGTSGSAPSGTRRSGPRA